MITVGIDMIPSCIGVAGFWSMSIFSTLILSPSSPWICSTIGAIMRHGPHQVAQKSTSTGLSDFRTAVSKSLSVTVWMSDIKPSFSYSPELDSDVLDSDLLSDLVEDSPAGLVSEPEELSESLLAPLLEAVDAVLP